MASSNSSSTAKLLKLRLDVLQVVVINAVHFDANDREDSEKAWKRFLNMRLCCKRFVEVLQRSKFVSPHPRRVLRSSDDISHALALGPSWAWSVSWLEQNSVPEKSMVSLLTPFMSVDLSDCN